MIAFPTRTQFMGLADIAATVYNHGENVARNALKSSSAGVLYYLDKISNTLCVMKKMASETLHRFNTLLSTNVKQSEPAQPPTLPTMKTPLNAISKEFTERVCYAMKREMKKDPAYLNHMFRSESSIPRAKINKLLHDEDAFIAAIESKKIDGITLSSLVKEWSEQTLAGNKFTAQQRQQLAAPGVTKNDVMNIFNAKFDTASASDRENKNKLVSLLSVMRTYKQMCVKHSAEAGRQFDGSVVDNVCSARLFALTADLSILKDETEEAGKAITVLLKYAYPEIAPKPQMFTRAVQQ